MKAITFLLSLILVSTCHGEEQGNSSTSSILATRKLENSVETHQEVLCPDPTDIEPCQCINDHRFYMDCSKVQDEEQLRKVFSADFPTNTFFSFVMDKNSGVKVLEDGVFGNVRFHVLDIRGSALETVEDDALASSLSILRYVGIQSSQLTTFPFEKLAEFTSLVYLRLGSNKIHTLPPLSSSSLVVLSLSHNLIAHLSPDAFKLLPAVQEISLNGNQLTEIPKGTFTDLPKLLYIHLAHNNISYLQSLTFEIVSSLDSNTGIFLDNNNIDSVAVDTFKGVIESVNISMSNNVLTRLPEEVWRSVLEKGNNLELAGNPLACGCDVAWLVRDTQLLTTITDARCADGTMLTDLNPADFDICG